MSKAQELRHVRKENGIGITLGEFTPHEQAGSLEKYYESILSGAEIEDSVKKYRSNIDRIWEEYDNTRGIPGADIPFLLFATFLQCARIYLINYVTKIEKAGSGNRNETRLHDFQTKTLGKLENGIIDAPHRYYAPLNQIITGRGVPYDATAYKYENMGIFKGGNHRFATLGHDPILGLIFGTANILTNTITCVNLPVISTYTVEYDIGLKNPQIADTASTIEMLKQVYMRMNGDIESVVAAIMKQLIHIGTDLYTPCGIQLPGINLILSHKNAEKITRIVSTGDVIKFGVSAGLSTLINLIIAVFHSWMIELTESNCSEELRGMRTRKIILLSNVFASSSNILYSVLMKDLKKLDIGGFVVTIKKLFCDEDVIKDLRNEFIGKYEFLNNEVSKLYENKIENLNLYYDV